jgi:hypothetical protein
MRIEKGGSGDKFISLCFCMQKHLRPGKPDDWLNGFKKGHLIETA